MKPHSGLQLQVLGLYRQALRIARRKDLAQDPLATKAASGSTTYAFVRERFREDVRYYGFYLVPVCQCWS